MYIHTHDKKTAYRSPMLIFLQSSFLCAYTYIHVHRHTEERKKTLVAFMTLCSYPSVHFPSPKLLNYSETYTHY